MIAEPTVFIVDDDPGVRKSLRLLMQSVKLPAETFETAQEFLDKFEPERPGCVLLDLRLPNMSGLELQQRLAAKGARLPVIFITGHGDIPTAVHALQAGAIDFIEKPFRGQALLDRIQKALQLDAEARVERVQHQETANRLELLSRGEREVLEGMCAGKPYKVIAKELELSYKTIEARRAKIVKKMQVDNLPALMRIVMSYRQWNSVQPQVGLASFAGAVAGMRNS